MNRAKLTELINDKVEDALREYYTALESESETSCVYTGDITPDELFYWDVLIEKFADLFEQLADGNRIELDENGKPIPLEDDWDDDEE